MKFLIRLFAAFCVATVMAQVIILGLSAFRGNLSQATVMQAIALLNGIDITGQRLEKAIASGRQAPIPTQEEVEEKRAQMNSNLDMRERSLKLQRDSLDALEAKLKLEIGKFDDRTKAFYAKLDELEKGAKDEGLSQVQRTLEAVPPEQAKEQLLKMIDGNQMKDVVAILKGMPADKSKKILSELITPAEAEKFAEIIKEMRKGDPVASLINQAR